MSLDLPPAYAKTVAAIAEALRRNEAGLQLALEAGEMGSWEWNIATGEVQWSENLEQMHGLPPGTFGGTFAAYEALIHPEDRARVLEAIRTSVETRADYEVEFRSAGPEDTARWMMGKGKVFADDQGASRVMLGVCMDITKRKLAESALLDANRRKDDFLAMISHELRNPLAAIMNAAALIDRVSGHHPVAANASATIQRHTEQLVRIVDDLLDVSRLTAGKLTLEPTALDLASVVSGCVEDFAARRLLEQHRYALRCVSASIRGDRPRIVQIVSNLLTNAIKYTPPGGQIDVAVEVEGGEAILRVKDSGIGVAPELVPRIFDMFVQSDRGLHRPDGGLGLGLTIVRCLGGAHGGAVPAPSAGFGKGTEIIVRLPLAAVGVTTDAAAAPPLARLPRQRILLIDDNVDAREALGALLRIAGHEVQQAGEAVAALEAAAREAPDVAIVHIRQPGIDGFELARRLRALAPCVRLIALTGYGHADHRRRGAEVGFEAYLVKPAGIEVLLRTLVEPTK